MNPVLCPGPPPQPPSIPLHRFRESTCDHWHSFGGWERLAEATPALVSASVWATQDLPRKPRGGMSFCIRLELAEEEGSLLHYSKCQASDTHVGARGFAVISCGSH